MQAAGPYHQGTGTNHHNKFITKPEGGTLCRAGRGPAEGRPTMAGRGTGRGQGRPTVPQAIEAIKDALGIDPVSAMDWPVNVHGWNVSLNTFLLSETVAPCVYYGQWQCGGRELPIVVVVLTNVTPRPPLAIAAVCTLASDRSRPCYSCDPVPPPPTLSLDT